MTHTQTRDFAKVFSYYCCIKLAKTIRKIRNCFVTFFSPKYQKKIKNISKKQKSRASTRCYYSKKKNIYILNRQAINILAGQIRLSVTQIVYILYYIVSYRLPKPNNII